MAISIRNIFPFSPIRIKRINEIISAIGVWAYVIIFFTKRIGLVETVYRREQSTSPEEVLVQPVVINDFLPVSP